MEEQNTENQNTDAEQPQQPQQPVQPQVSVGDGSEQIPNATAALVLGIISIPTCFCYGIVGLICGIIGLVLSGKAKRLYEAEPDRYTESSYNNLKAGRVCAIIGTILGGLSITFFIVYIIMIVAVGGTFAEIFSNQLLEEMSKH